MQRVITIFFFGLGFIWLGSWFAAEDQSLGSSSARMEPSCNNREHNAKPKARGVEFIQACRTDCLAKIRNTLKAYHKPANLSKIYVAKDLDALAALLRTTDEETLVLWDVDDVLIKPVDAFFMDVPIRKRLYEKLYIQYSKEKRKLIFSHFFERRRVELVNPEILSLLADLARRQIPYAGLSAWWTGPYGTIPCMEDLLFKSLEAVGISFVETSPFKEDIILTAFKSKEGTPMVKNGLILTALADKGVILKAVLAARQLAFRSVVLIDDNRQNLQAVQKVCKELKIDFLGIHYTEAKHRPLPLLNKAREKQRFQILEQKGLWLLDEELEGWVNQPNPKAVQL